MSKYAKLFQLLVLLSLIIVMVSCSSGGSSAPSGTLSVSLTDAAVGGFEAVNITVSKVRVHQSTSASDGDSGWSEIVLNPARKINLLDLANGVLEELGQVPLPAGHYTQLRLVLSANTGMNTANSVVLSGTTTEIPLVTPSAMHSGIKLINEFDVAPGQRVDLVLDFDALKSVVRRGNGSYGLMPVIRCIPSGVNGIDGFVDPALLGSGVMASAQVNGEIVRSSAPNAQTGEFFLARLVPGSYDVVITADGRATAVIVNVPISSPTGTVIVSTSAAPISLPTATTRTISGVITLNPPDATTVAYVSTKQTFTAGPTITVKSQGADLLSGDYSLTLPAGAPLLGQYGAGTLPIAFIAQSTATGIYAVEAAATGYVTQSVSRDISSSNGTADFILTP